MRVLSYLFVLCPKYSQIKKWLSNGDGGYTPYEPYITNGDILCMSIGTLIVSGIIVLGCYLSEMV